MAKSNGRSSRRKRKRPANALRTRVLLGVLLGTFSVLLTVALVSYLTGGHWRIEPNALAARMGRLNHLAAAGTIRWLGVTGGLLVPLALATLALRILSGRRIPRLGRRTFGHAGAAALLVSAAAALPGEGLGEERALFAGWIGRTLAHGLQVMFGRIGAAIVLGGAAVAFLAWLGIPVFAPFVRLGPPLARLVARVRAGMAGALAHLREATRTLDPGPAGSSGEASRAASSGRGTLQDAAHEGAEILVLKTPQTAPDDAAWEGGAAERLEIPATKRSGEEPSADSPDRETEGKGPTPIPEGVPLVVLPSAGEPAPPRPPAPEAPSLEDLHGPEAVLDDSVEPYVAPPQNFLERDEEDPQEAEHREALLESAKLLERTLREFGVKGKVTQVQPGPVITRYEIEPAPGQKVAPIAGLSDDLALALRARSIRIVAPIPGKAAVGIEVPNARPKVVRLGSLLETPEFQAENESALNIALGRTIAGDGFYAALDRMPHVLVAGATGSGKSVCINTIITSIIYNAGPDEVRFIMVDPKMLELMSYVGLPHLIPPVVTQPKEAAKILKWTVGEMEARYRTLAHVGVRSITDYNIRQEREGAGKMPYLVVIVDELADLMLSNMKSEIEESIARLAQMARAVGIHLVVATQRPSVDVITGVIKANFPSRIAFQVPTRTDSRTILDSIGAERLLGKGDMLYLGVGMAQPIRVHGSYISTEETIDVVEWLKNRNPISRVDGEGEGGNGNPSPLDEDNDLFPRDREDDLFEEAARILVAHQQGSISLLQRRLKVGYARAARLVDMMEEAGIVGPFTGSKAREILVPTVEELDRKLAAAKKPSMGG